MYDFDEVITLFISDEELNNKELKEFFKRRKITIDEKKLNEGVLEICVIGGIIDINFILELEYILDKTISLTYRYMGSAETVKSLGL